MKATRWLALAAAVTLAACGGDDNGTTGPGNGAGFNADVTGDVTATVKGAALYGSYVDPEMGPVFAVEMAEDAPGEGVIQLIRLGGGATPAPGTYVVADALNGSPEDGDFVAVAFDADNGTLTAVFVGISGTVKITGTGGNLRGTFSFNAEGGLVEDPETTLGVKVKGSFSAKPAPAGLKARPAAIRRSR